jgi:hypothetical protein
MVNPDLLAYKAADGIEPFEGARGFRLTLSRYFRDSLPPWMSPFLQSQARASGDAALLRIVMGNLLQNA